jgi:hypothetical protein
MDGVLKLITQMYQENKLPFLSYLSYLVFISLDQVTTFIGINRFSLQESNSVVLLLMDKGLWSIFDYSLSFLLIGLSYILYDKVLNREHRFVVLLPMVSGSIRLFAGLSNLALILQMI